MIKIFLNILKKVVISGFLLYGYNLIAVNFNMIIPINILTLLIVTFLGSPAIAALILFKVLML